MTFPTAKNDDSKERYNYVEIIDLIDTPLAKACNVDLVMMKMENQDEVDTFMQRQDKRFH